MICTKTLGICGLGLALVCFANPARAAIISEGAGATLRYGYGATAGGLDANTSHYWSLDEEGPPFADGGSSPFLIPMASQTSTALVSSVLQAPGGATNNARRIGTSATTANRITAFANTTNTLGDNITLDQANSFAGANGAISVDLLVRPDFGQVVAGTSAMRIITQENDEGNDQNLSISYSATTAEAHTVGAYFGSIGLSATVPFTGDHALAAGSWYHLAVTYNGDENGTDNVKFYWTKVNGVDDTTTEANLIGTATLSADPLVLTAQPEFTFGNETQGTINKSWFGALDEIRISSVERGAGEFIFVPEPSSMMMSMAMLSLGSCFVRWLRKLT